MLLMFDRPVAMVVASVECWNENESAMLGNEESPRHGQVNNKGHGGEDMPRQRSPLR